MKALAFVIVIGAFIRHDAANWLAGVSGMTAAAIFYVLGGLWEMVLCALILWLVTDYGPSIWRSLAMAGCLIGALEGFQVFACRLAISDIKAVPRGANLCDYATGFPVGAVTTSLYLLAICYHVGRAYRGRRTG